MVQLSKPSAVDKGNHLGVQGPLEVSTHDEKRQRLSSTNVLGAPASPIYQDLKDPLSGTEQELWVWEPPRLRFPGRHAISMHSKCFKLHAHHWKLLDY